MKKLSVLLGKVALILVAVGAFIWLIKFPMLEGRAANLDLINIYADPLIIYGYIASIPFFVGLFQGFKLLHFIEKKQLSSKGAIDAFRSIKLSAYCLIGFIVLAEFILIFLIQGEEKVGPGMLGVYSAILIAIIAALASTFEKRLQKGKGKKK